jgi:2-succinyl-5-enolpyruvyl-6-hydroxy-3-cyclohexene-1-carboxylate synthase
MESFESSTPLIILTADRPFELQDSGANQTTLFQSSLYQNYVAYSLDLPAPDPLCIENLQQLVHKASYLSDKHLQSVHINCSFREPFDLTLTCNTISLNTKPLVSYAFEQSLSIQALQAIAALLNNANKGVVILGTGACKDSTNHHLNALISLLNWPVFSDILSLYEPSITTIKNYNLIFKNSKNLQEFKEDFSFDCVIHFGGSCVSKHLMQFLKNICLTTYIHVHALDKRFDPMHLVTHKVEMKPEAFASQIAPFIKLRDYPSPWKLLDQKVESILDTFFTCNSLPSEPLFFWKLGKALSQRLTLFIGNSMPIRDLSDFFHPTNDTFATYANRGLSGIDGNISSAIGLCKALNKPVLAIIGDQTFLHDATALSQISTLHSPLKLIVLNNHGGHIFSHLPISQHQNICLDFFVNPHGFSIEHIAKAFKVPYIGFSSLDTFFSDEDLLSNSYSCVIELRIEAAMNLKTHKELSYLIQDALSSFFSHV